MFEVYRQMCSPCFFCHTIPNVVLSTVVNKHTNVCMHAQLQYIIYITNSYQVFNTQCIITYYATVLIQ